MNDRPRPDTDRGAVLALTLVLTVALTAIVVAVAGFATVGLRTAKVATDRTLSNADASAGLSWAIEELSKKQIRPSDHCGEAPVYESLPVPAAVMGNDTVVTVTCAMTAQIGANPTVHLVSVSSGSQQRQVEAVVEVPVYRHGAWIADWRVDMEMPVPDYTATTTTTTTTVPVTTTTTTVPATTTTIATTTTTAPGPGPFSKDTPDDDATGVNRNTVVLDWSSSTGSTGYEWCLDTTVNGSCDTAWVSATDTSVDPGNLERRTGYEWQVRAVDAGSSLEADGGTWFEFTTN